MKTRRLLKGSNQFKDRNDNTNAYVGLSTLAALTILIVAAIVYHPCGSALLSPVPAHAEEIAGSAATLAPVAQDSDEDLFVKRVHYLESSNGTNTNPQALHNLCKAQGLSNEYGYGGMAMMVCFPDQATAEAKVRNWFRQRHFTEGIAVENLYCFYNQGRITTDCAYYQNALAVKGGEEK